MTSNSDRTALAHDYLLVMRGAERSFAAIAACWPESPIYTLLYDARGTDRRFEGRNVRTSYLQRFRVRQRGFRALLPLFPRAVEHLDVAWADVVISSSSAFAHGVRARPGAPHICYCYTPFRYAYYERERAMSEAPALARPALSWTLDHFRRWDGRAAERVTGYIAISRLGQERIGACYGRQAAIVHPPVETHRFHKATPDPEDFFLVVCELVRHKRVDVALEAARLAGARIKIVGAGPERERLEARYGSDAEFLGRLDDDQLAALYPRARALVMPNVEEFGITAVEAQAAGRPVVAIDAGGARETVRDGETGVLVPEGDVTALAEAIRETDFARFSSAVLRENAERFSLEAFQQNFKREVAAAVSAR